MAPASRVIVIDNVEELDMVENPRIDLSMWLVNESLKDATFSALIKNALRNNPDYIMVAEARGGEMLDGLLSSMSGHPIISSVHAQDIEAMPERIARLAMLGNERLYKEELLDDIAHHLRYYVYLEKKENPDGSLSRHLQSIGYLDEKSKTMQKLYERSHE
jgi:pilus assembly protein CpaF